MIWCLCIQTSTPDDHCQHTHTAVQSRSHCESFPIANNTVLCCTADRQGPLELQDIKVAFVPSAQTLSSDAVASGSFQLTAAGSFPPAAEAHPTTQAASGAQQANRLAHQWLWQPEVSQVLAGIHHNAGLPIISKSVSVHAHAGRVDNAVQSKAQHQTHQLKGEGTVCCVPADPCCCWSVDSCNGLLTK